MILRDQQHRAYSARALLRMTQAELAHALDTTQARVSHWERIGTMNARHMLALEGLLRAQGLAQAPSILRLHAATLARAVLEEHKAGALVSRRTVQLAQETSNICERG